MMLLLLLLFLLLPSLTLEKIIIFVDQKQHKVVGMNFQSQVERAEVALLEMCQQLKRGTSESMRELLQEFYKNIPHQCEETSVDKKFLVNKLHFCQVLLLVSLYTFLHVYLYSCILMNVIMYLFCVFSCIFVYVCLVGFSCLCVSLMNV